MKTLLFALIALFPALAHAQNASPTAVTAPWPLVALGAGAAALTVRGRRKGSPPPLMRVAQLDLAGRSHLTLVEVEGQRLLVVHGEGFAALHALPSAAVPLPSIGEVTP